MLDFDMPIVSRKRFAKSIFETVTEYCKVLCLGIFFTSFIILFVIGAEWHGAGLCDREVAGSTAARGCCVPTPTQRAIPPGSVIG